MGLLGLLPTYLVWHYTQAISDLKKIAVNFLWFIFNFFSIEILLKTLFAPWKRLSKDETSRHPSFFSNLVVNVLMRLVGFLVRSLTIILGLFSLIIVFLVFVFGFFVWFAMPFLIPAIFLYGLGFFL